MCEKVCDGRPAGWSVVSGVVGAASIGGAGIAHGKAAGNVVKASSTILHVMSLFPARQMHVHVSKYGSYGQKFCVKSGSQGQIWNA